MPLIEAVLESVADLTVPVSVLVSVPDVDDLDPVRTVVEEV